MARDRPVNRAEADHVAHAEAEFAGKTVPDHDLAGAGREDTACRKRDAIADRWAGRIHAAQRQRTLPHIDRHDDFAGRDEFAVLIAGDAEITRHGVERADDGCGDVRARLLIGAAAKDHGDEGRACAGQRRLEAFRHG